MKVFEVNDPLFLPHCGSKLQLSLALGEAKVLVGENGIGKSTLMGRLFSQLKSEERTVVEQKSSDYFFDRKLKTLKEIFLTADLDQFDELAFLRLWRAFGLELKENRLISNLSGGETQALKLTSALCKSVQFYFLDEPSQFLDVERKKILLQYLQDLRSQDKSILVIEHNRDWIPKEWEIEKLYINDGVLTLGDEWTIS